METYGGSSDNKALTEASDELTGQQEKYDLLMSMIQMNDIFF